MYIKMYVTEKEKKQLEQIAQQKKIPLSKLCYEQVIPLLYHSMKDSTLYLPHQTDWEKYTHSH